MLLFLLPRVFISLPAEKDFLYILTKVGMPVSLSQSLIYSLHNKLITNGSHFIYLFFLLPSFLSVVFIQNEYMLHKA